MNHMLNNKINIYIYIIFIFEIKTGLSYNMTDMLNMIPISLI